MRLFNVSFALLLMFALSAAQFGETLLGFPLTCNKVLHWFYFYFLYMSLILEGDECTLTDSKGIGICKPARLCPKVVELNRQGQRFTTCSFMSGVHIVCCPFEATTPQPIATRVDPIDHTGRISAKSKV